MIPVKSPDTCPASNQASPLRWSYLVESEHGKKKTGPDAEACDKEVRLFFALTAVAVIALPLLTFAIGFGLLYLIALVRSLT
ncbi:MAG TPA: hypothetical protein VHC22_29460 [Pirellulales bacterium]|nr:hypothetical protein [Pirellulales bacterium]